VFILEGKGTLEHDGDISAIRAGDAAFILPNKVHQFVNTSNQPLKFLCVVPISFDCGQVTPGS
ncbi:MAG TPA: cupin domain-containing protein, partial [Phycisphaerales bacterium]|nr:cupin domain-containing protein [Phycisphaerales bacterium]